MCRMRYEPMPSKMPERTGAGTGSRMCEMRVWNPGRDSPEGKICEECVDDMSAEEILKLCGESLTEAEKEER